MCRPGFSRAWCVATREGTVERVIDSYKFDRARSAYRDIADVLDMVVPVLPGNVVVVPVPTIARHIRKRGYDHTLLIARYFAKKRQLELNTHSLMRVSNTSQFGASKKQRELQAQRAFASTRRLDGTKTYLLVDDIYTTGATLRHAARILKDAGAGDVWVAVVAKQTLVKS